MKSNQQKNVGKNIVKGLVNNMKTLNQYMEEQLKNDAFKKEWENSQPELDVIRACLLYTSIDSGGFKEFDYIP